ncbi:hypothetical protein TD95_003317 [Thielaviopsis punctulata]|uniref:Flavin reductase like domain-containing protein n=1 Tax=Thielaviopsis punctulata TaxID=72032 RepID=A0A0F4ZCD8_9PEZI|nr:hypothetical protein TD95_003317 [Thielaviopsis punctulata]
MRAFTSSAHAPAPLTTAQGIAPQSPPGAAPDTLSDQLRHLMRRLSHSVVVCTSSQASANGPRHRAMTMSSFTSLALAPRPLVTFNVKAPSSTLDAIIASRTFNIHVLSADAQGARVAEWFTRGNVQADPFSGLHALGDGWTCVHARGEPPALQGDGILSRVRCRVLCDGDGHDKGIVRISDHVIILGEVQEVFAGSSQDSFALTYADRMYRTEGGMIQSHSVPNNKT